MDQRGKNGRAYTTTVLILLAVNVFLGVLIAVTVHFRSLEKESIARDVPFCLPCSDVLGHPDDGIPEGIDVRQNGTTCCAKDVANLSMLIEAFTINWHDKMLHTENPTFSKCKTEDKETRPLLKVVFSDIQSVDGKSEVDWETSLERSPVDLVLSGDHVTIHKTGLYYIYSQISMQLDSHSAEQLPQQHIIGVKEVGSSSEMYTKIAKGSNSQCKFHGQKHNSTSYMATLYQLQRGDRVAVQVYDKDQIIPNKHMNFFGMHMV